MTQAAKNAKSTLIVRIQHDFFGTIMPNSGKSPLDKVIVFARIMNVYKACRFPNVYKAFKRFSLQFILYFGFTAIEVQSVSRKGQKFSYVVLRTDLKSRFDSRDMS